MTANLHDPVNNPHHYTRAHSGGMECIDLVERMTFCGGNAVKYLWRAGHKSNRIEDLHKARWYVERQMANDVGESDVFASARSLHAKAILGFPPITGAAMIHIIREDYDLALHAIDALIAGAE